MWKINLMAISLALGFLVCYLYLTYNEKRRMRNADKKSSHNKA